MVLRAVRPCVTAVDWLILVMAEFEEYDLVERLLGKAVELVVLFIIVLLFVMLLDMTFVLYVRLDG